MVPAVKDQKNSLTSGEKVGSKEAELSQEDMKCSKEMSLSFALFYKAKVMPQLKQ